MIGMISGLLQVDASSPGLWCVCPGDSDIGYDINVANMTAPCVPIRPRLLIHHVMREDGSQELYGFAEATSRELFRKLINVRGVGAKTAMGLLRQMNAPELATMIGRDDVAGLAKLKGIGKKTAAQIILALRDKLTPAQPAEAVVEKAAPKVPVDGPRADAVRALMTLGSTRASAEARVAGVPKQYVDTASIVTQALRNGSA